MGTVGWNIRSSTACVKSDGQLTQRLPCCLCARSSMSLSQTTERSPGAEHQKPGHGILTDTPDTNLPLSKKHIRQEEEDPNMKNLYPRISFWDFPTGLTQVRV